VGVQKHYKKTVYKTNRVEKFYKKIDKNPKPIFSQFVLTRFWAFLGEGSLKTRPKNLTQKSGQPWYFVGLRGTNQPPQGPSFFFFSAPCCQSSVATADSRPAAKFVRAPRRVARPRPLGYDA
jgi:hypothetical protein